MSTSVIKSSCKLHRAILLLPWISCNHATHSPMWRQKLEETEYPFCLSLKLSYSSLLFKHSVHSPSFFTLKSWPPDAPSHLLTHGSGDLPMVHTLGYHFVAQGALWMSPITTACAPWVRRLTFPLLDRVQAQHLCSPQYLQLEICPPLAPQFKQDWAMFFSQKRPFHHTWHNSFPSPKKSSEF